MDLARCYRLRPYSGASSGDRHSRLQNYPDPPAAQTVSPCLQAKRKVPPEDLLIMERLRIARITDVSTLRKLLQAALASNARLEMVCKNRSRWPIALRLDRTSLCSLIGATRPGSDAWLELVFPAQTKR
jgi:hypothetical protein